MLEATLEGMQPHRWMEIAVGGYSAKVEILDSKLPTPDTVQHLFDIQVRPDMMDEVVGAMRKDKDLTGLEVIRSKNGHVYGSAASSRCTVCKEVAKSKCFLSSVSVVSKDKAHWTVLGSDDSFRGLMRSLEKSKIPFVLRMQKRLEDTDLLTTRQEQILSIAFEGGYFDFPKRIGLKELAAATAIKTSTLAEILRRGQKKILGEYLARRLLLHRDLAAE
ncbi:MAG: helix-turn-helix domain-containing protein [Nitrososphaerota archaeon]|nr:helix-turn-helix domain-containing protein [Nitrososphaerota archaeon]